MTRIIPAQKFSLRPKTDDAPEADAFTLAAMWLDGQRAEGFEPVAIEVRGTTGHCVLTGANETHLVLVPIAPIETKKRKAP